MTGTTGATGLWLTRSPDVGALASELVGWLGRLGADPFEAPVVFVPGAGMRRWLSQTIARSSGPEGICAGVRFESWSRLESLLSGHDEADDPWTPQRLVWRILQIVDTGIPGLEPLAHHLAASEQRYANALRVATLLNRYARLRPAMLATWAQADDVDSLGLGFDGWQAALWRALLPGAPGPDPVTRRAQLIAEVSAGRQHLRAPAVGVFCPRGVTAADADLLAALAAHQRVPAWVTGPREPALSGSLGARLGARGAETVALLAARAAHVADLELPPRPATLIGAVQASVAGESARPRPVAVDPSVRIHASHGLQRQAEVLREALSGAFEEDPTLEPRHVVVMCPDPDALAPHIEAAFGVRTEGPAHPGRSLRVKVVQRSSADSNDLYGLVRSVALLPASRATAAQLLALAGHPFVARRFGFGEDDAERLADLIDRAAVRWGLGDAHRQVYGLERVRQGTWQVGVQRLLLGEALGDDELASAGVIAPVDDVESSDVVLLGGLAELVSRVTRLVRRPERASTADWVAHYREIVTLLADVPFDQAWQQAQLWGVLDTIARRSAVSPAELAAADALALLDAEFAGQRSRPSFGDGSLLVCGLGDVAQVPHRMVCLAGLDERTFPRRGIADGDDLVARAPEPGDPDPGRDDRQAILDAVAAAGERLLVVYQGWSSHTREDRPAPAGLADVLEVAAELAGVRPTDLVTQEPLQPFSATLFGGQPRSFDQTALAAARVLSGELRVPARNRFDVSALPSEPTPAAIDLDQVKSFLAHPAKYLLRERAQLTLDDDEPEADQLPLELNGLQRWAVGDRVLEALLQGRAPQEAQHAEWLRGQLPPGNLGRRILDQVTDTACQVAGDAAPFMEGELGFHTIDSDFGGVRLTGRAMTRADATVAVHYSRVSAKHLSASWVDALALTASLERPVDAVILGGGVRRRLRSPEPDEARRRLDDLVALAIEGRQRLLPLPPRVGLLWAECRARNADPLADRNLSRRWEWDRDETWVAVLGVGARPWEATIEREPWAQPGERTVLGSLAALLWRPIVRADR